MTEAELEDLIADAIRDSLDENWTARDGAQAVLRELERENLVIVKRRRPTLRREEVQRVGHAA